MCPDTFPVWTQQNARTEYFRKSAAFVLSKSRTGQKNEIEYMQPFRKDDWNKNDWRSLGSFDHHDAFH